MPYFTFAFYSSIPRHPDRSEIRQYECDIVDDPCATLASVFLAPMMTALSGLLLS